MVYTVHAHIYNKNMGNSGERDKQRERDRNIDRQRERIGENGKISDD